jgi:hypothetical protein
MNTLVIAKSRAARRRRQSGAVMFLVTMTLAVLASVGLYALAAATSEVQASGSERQATQTHYLSEYAVVAGMQLMTAGRAQSYLNVMTVNPDTGCMSLPQVTATTQPDNILRACTHVVDTELAKSDGWTGSIYVDAGAPAAPTPQFLVEFTGLSKASSPPRYALDLHICFVGMTASAYGTTLPPNEGVIGSSPTFFGEGIEAQRARIVAGPVMGALCQ